MGMIIFSILLKQRSIEKILKDKSNRIKKQMLLLKSSVIWLPADTKVKSVRSLVSILLRECNRSRKSLISKTV